MYELPRASQTGARSNRFSNRGRSSQAPRASGISGAGRLSRKSRRQSSFSAGRNSQFRQSNGIDYSEIKLAKSSNFGRNSGRGSGDFDGGMDEGPMNVESKIVHRSGDLRRSIRNSRGSNLRGS